MSFRQPTTITVRSYHFRGNVYELPVESVLEPEQGGGKLQIEASAGYLLTTLENSTSQSQQTLSYVVQPDGSWIARTVVTVWATGPALISGVIALRNPVGETLILTVIIETFLFVDGSIITFDTKPNEAVFASLKITQQGADTPVVLAIDDADQFALATSINESNFASSLTITPAFGGTYIYIRYAPERSGRHTASLSVKTPYDSQTVSLQGHTPGVLSWLRLPQWPDSEQSQELQSQPVATTRTRKTGILAILLLSVLAFVGYVYRCQLAPGWCQSQNDVAEMVIPASDTTFVNAPVSSDDIRTERSKNNSIKNTEIAENAGAISTKLGKSKVTSPTIMKVDIKGPSSVGRSVRSYNQIQSKPRRIYRLKPAEHYGESDLEKELNGKPIDQNP